MSGRIDHVSKALRNIEGLHDYQAEEGMSDESMLTVAIEAQVHATLALVEQQRIANLEAILVNGARMVAEGTGDRAAYAAMYARINPLIEEALGLS